MLIYCRTILGTYLGQSIRACAKDFDVEESIITIKEQLQALEGSRLNIGTL